MCAKSGPEVSHGQSRYLRQHLARVGVDGVTARGLHDRHAGKGDALAMGIGCLVILIFFGALAIFASVRN